MIKHHADKLGNIVSSEEATPVCGDFCDRCGDCLACYEEDKCLDEVGHLWVVYDGEGKKA